MMQEKLIELLDKYIEEYEKIKEKLHKSKTNQTLYEEIINILNENDLENAKLSIPLLLNTIYGDNIYIDEFYRILYSSQPEEKLTKFYYLMKEELNQTIKYNESLKKKKNKMYNNNISARKIKKSILLKTTIQNLKDIYNVEKIIEYYTITGEISSKEKLLLINEIELYNRKLATKTSSNEELIYTESLYNEIPNILMMGFQEHDTINISNEKSNTLNKFCKEIINQSIQLKSSEIIELLKEYQKYNLEQNEYNYIIVAVLNYYINELIACYILLLESDDAKIRKDRVNLINDYYINLDKYIQIINYYNEINELIETDNELTESELKELNNSQRLIYSLSEVNPSKTKLMQDMDDVPYEYYETVQDLLSKFKNGIIGINKIKRIRYNSKNSGYIELKDDQIRIILKHIKDDIYNVYGVFVKKDDNDMFQYKKIMNRTAPIINTDEKLKLQLELSKHTEEELNTLINTKARKNFR